MKKNKGFSLKLCSNLDFEGMVVDIAYNDQIIATGNYDKGVEHMEINLLPVYTDNKNHWESGCYEDLKETLL